MKRTTIFLPDGLHQKLRREAFERNMSMAELIRSALTSRGRSPDRATLSDDPLLAVASIGNDAALTQDLDEELYDL